MGLMMYVSAYRTSSSYLAADGQVQAMTWLLGYCVVAVACRHVQLIIFGCSTARLFFALCCN